MHTGDVRKGYSTYDGQSLGSGAPIPESSENIIVKSALPVLEYLVMLKQKMEQGEILSPDVIRKDGKALLASVEDELLKYPHFHSRRKTIKYVLTALIDEVVIFSSWQYAAEWQAHPLEMEIFGESIAGEKFFALLENDGYRDPELAELFFICLSIGFNRKIVRETGMKQRLYALINDRIPEDERRISPGAEEAVIRPDSNLPPLFGVVAVTTVLVVSALVYTISSQMIWHEASKFIHDVSVFLTKGN